MAIDDRDGQYVTGGWWLYDGTHPERIAIVARNYDIQFSMYDADGMLDPDDLPVERGPDGLLYYVEPGMGRAHRTLADAKAFAEMQPWAPIDWD